MTFAFVIRFLLAALALYRVAWFTREDGPFALSLRFRQWLGKLAAAETFKTGFEQHGFFWTLAEVANCPHCIGVWLAIPAALVVIFPSNVTDVILIVLALAGLQSFLTGRSDEE
jgi:hypothetical protein